MLVSKVMVTDVEYADVQGNVGEALIRMRERGLRMLPVLDAERKVVGILSTLSVLEHVAPRYVSSGDLNNISYAPDLGVLRRHFNELSDHKVFDLMDDKPLCVDGDESLLSVSAGLIRKARHDYAIVVDHDHHLLGVISAGDIVDRVRALGEEDFDA